MSADTAQRCTFIATTLATNAAASLPVTLFAAGKTIKADVGVRHIARTIYTPD